MEASHIIILNLVLLVAYNKLKCMWSTWLTFHGWDLALFVNDIFHCKLNHLKDKTHLSYVNGCLAAGFMPCLDYFFKDSEAFLCVHYWFEWRKWTVFFSPFLMKVRKDFFSISGIDDYIWILKMRSFSPIKITGRQNAYGEMEPTAFYQTSS